MAIPVIWWLTRSFIALGVPLAMKVNWQTAGLSLLVALTSGTSERLLAGVQCLAHEHCGWAAAHWVRQLGD